MQTKDTSTTVSRGRGWRRAAVGVALVGALAGASVQGAGSAAASTPDEAIAWLNANAGSTGYDGLCELMVENAYGTSGQYATAEDDYEAQLNAGAIHTDTSPPAGALVFFSGTTSAGHVEISNGDGQYWDSDGTIHFVDLSYGGTYYGWSYAPGGWTG